MASPRARPFRRATPAIGGWSLLAQRSSCHPWSFHLLPCLEPVEPVGLAAALAIGFVTLAYALVRWLVALSAAKRVEMAREVEAGHRPSVAARYRLPPGQIRNRWLVLTGAALSVLALEMVAPDSDS